MSIATRPVSILLKGTALSRFIMALGAGRGDTMRTRMIAESAQWKDSPQVVAVLEGWQTKAAVSPASTTDATFMGPFATYGVAGEALELERGKSVIGAIESRMRRVPFRTKVNRETGAGTGGAWVAEGNSTPVVKTAYHVLSQEVYKAQVIVVMTDKLMRLSNPSAERTVREPVIAGLVAFLDAQFLTSTVTLIANTRPAAIAAGAASITSTGSTAAAINADLAAMLAAITTAGGGLTWIMKLITAYRIAATIGGTAAADIPRSLFGIPIVLSINSPQQVTLIDANAILYSDDNGIDISTTEHATLQMSDTPTDPAVSSTVFESLWARNLWAVRVTRWLAYLRAQRGVLHGHGVLNMAAKRRQPADAGPAEIDAWHQWLVAAHTKRLRDACLTPAEFDRELVAVTAQVDAIAERAKSDYLAWTSR